MSSIYIGIDCATTTGIAIYIPEENKAKVIQYKGSPIQLIGFMNIHLLDGSYHEATFVLEKPVHFLNANTTRSLLERYGFIKYTLMDYNHLPVELNLNSVRSYLGCKSKGDVKHYFLPMYKGKKTFTDNHSDALALTIYQSAQDGFQSNPLELVITDMETR